MPPLPAQKTAKPFTTHRKVLAAIVLLPLGLAVLLVLFALWNPFCIGSKQDRARSQISVLTNGLQSLHKHTGSYPEPLHALQTLVDKQYLEELEKDPWGNDFVYTLVGETPVVTSYGQDGEPGGFGYDEDLSGSPRG